MEKKKKRKKGVPKNRKPWKRPLCRPPVGPVLAIPGRVTGTQGIHPVLRILMAAPTTSHTPRKLHFTSLVNAVERLRGGFLRGIRFRRGGTAGGAAGMERALQYLEESEYAKSWCLSDDFLTAPLAWPPGVAEEFRRAPTPFEMAQLKFKNHTFNQALLFCYTCGMSVEFLSDLLCLSSDAVIALMRAGVLEFRGSAAFELWCLHLDWSRVVLPQNMAEGLLDRLAIKNQLLVCPLDVEEEKARLLVDSPRFMAYAMAVAPRKHGFRPRSIKCRDGYFVRFPWGEDGEEGEEEGGDAIVPGDSE